MRIYNKNEINYFIEFYTNYCGGETQCKEQLLEAIQEKEEYTEVEIKEIFKREGMGDVTLMICCLRLLVDNDADECW